MKTLPSLALLTGLALASPLFAAERDDQVRGDIDALKDDAFWTYNDLDAGIAKARESGKPLFVVLRCIP